MSDSENASKLESFFRNRYFHGKLMTVKDFELEQNYFNSKRHLINRTVNGTGLVRGLYVEDVKQRQDDSWESVLSEGMLIDRNGNEIIVPNKKSYKINSNILPDDEKFGLYIKSKIEGREDVSTPLSGTSCNESCQKNLIEEKFELFFDRFIESSTLKFELPKAGESKINRYSHEYYMLRDNKNSCTDCHSSDDSQLLLAVLQKDDAGRVTILKDATQYQRKIVYDNTMIYDILQNHISNSENPHNISAESIGALSSINDVSHPNIVFKSDSLKFITEKNDPTQKHNLASHEIKVELQSQSFSVVTGQIQITEITNEKYQFFGPVYFPSKYHTPPLITLAKSANSNTVEYMEDFAPAFLSNSAALTQENKINFKVLHVTNEKFSIALENNSDSAVSDPLNLRYWIVPSTGDDNPVITLPDASHSAIKVQPFHPISDEQFKVEIVDDKIPNETEEIQIVATSIIAQKTKTILAHRTHTELDQFEAKVSIGDLTDLPGDIIRITHENDHAETKIEPKIVINRNTFYDISESFNLTLIDYSKRSDPTVDIVLKIGKQDTVISVKNTGDSSQSMFSYSLPRIENLQSEFQNYDIFGRGRGLQASYLTNMGDHQKPIFTNSSLLIPSFDYKPKDKLENQTWDRDEDLIAFELFDSVSIPSASGATIFVNGVLSNGKATPAKPFLPSNRSFKNEDGTKEFGFFKAFSLSDWLDHKFDRRISRVTQLKARYVYRRTNDDNSKPEFVVEKIINLPG